MTEEQFLRLPRWAQTEVERLIRERNAYEARLHALETTPGTDRGEISHGDHRRPWRGIPRGDAVRFHVDDDGGCVEVRVEPEGVLVRGQEGRLAVLPRSGSNMVAVRLEPFAR